MGLLLTHVDVISLRKYLAYCIFMSSLFCGIEFCCNIISSQINFIRFSIKEDYIFTDMTLGSYFWY